MVSADERLFCHFRRWAGGELESGKWTGTAGFPNALVVVTTPQPWRFLVAFCEQREQEITSLLLLKNVVPLYDLPGASATDELGSEVWSGIRRATLLYNPGLDGCLKLFGNRASVPEGMPLCSRTTISSNAACGTNQGRALPFGCPLPSLPANPAARRCILDRILRVSAGTQEVAAGSLPYALFMDRREMVPAAGSPRGLTKGMTGEQRMLVACGLRPADCTPVWFMRQAGRSLLEYRELRKKHDILAMQRDPETAAMVTLMPVDRLGVDAAVIYADIMLPLDIMGLEFKIEPSVGPIIGHPVRTRADVERLVVGEAKEGTPYLFDAIRIVSRDLAGRTAVVGFAGSPFTLACYMIEGRPSRDYGKAKSLMYGDPMLWHQLLEKITEVTVGYLRAQVEAGAQVIQLFDSWVGALSPDTYEKFVLPYSKRIFSEVRANGVPTIHFGTGAAQLLELMAEAGPNLVSVDWRVPLDSAWKRVGYDKGMQGNLDPTVVLTNSWPAIEERARDVLRRAGGRPGHVFNLGHGVLPATDPALLTHLREFVHEETAREETIREEDGTE